MKELIISNKTKLCIGMQKDLNKSITESYECEIRLVINELDHFIGNLKNYMKSRTISNWWDTDCMVNFPYKSYIINQPLGTALIISSWNYPILLSLLPLVGCLAAGNKAVVSL